MDKKLSKYVVSFDEMRASLERLHEHGLYQCYFSDFDHKITMTIYDDGVVEMMLVDRTSGNMNHKIHHFEFKAEEDGGKLFGKRK